MIKTIVTLTDGTEKTYDTVPDRNVWRFLANVPYLQDVKALYDTKSQSVRITIVWEIPDDNK